MVSEEFKEKSQVVERLSDIEAETERSLPRRPFPSVASFDVVVVFIFCFLLLLRRESLLRLRIFRLSHQMPCSVASFLLFCPSVCLCVHLGGCIPEHASASPRPHSATPAPMKGRFVISYLVWGIEGFNLGIALPFPSRTQCSIYQRVTK